MNKEQMNYLQTKKIVAPNPDCKACKGKNVNPVKRVRDACPQCWPMTASIKALGEGIIDEVYPCKMEPINEKAKELDSRMKPKPEDKFKKETRATKKDDGKTDKKKEDK